jgi:hypothetical protein
MGTRRSTPCMWNPQRERKQLVAQPEYEVRALGTLPASAGWEFRRLVVADKSVETVLHAPVSNSSALVSLLTRLENLGLNVVAFHRLVPGRTEGFD